jgi:hypothetical protein
MPAESGVKALALRRFLQMQAGQIDRTQYTAAHSAQLTDDAVKVMSHHLNEYGASPKRAEILHIRSEGTQTLYLVIAIRPVATAFERDRPEFRSPAGSPVGLGGGRDGSDCGAARSGGRRAVAVEASCRPAQLEASSAGFFSGKSSDAPQSSRALFPESVRWTKGKGGRAADARDRLTRSARRTAGGVESELRRAIPMLTADLVLRFETPRSSARRMN